MLFAFAAGPHSDAMLLSGSLFVLTILVLFFAALAEPKWQDASTVFRMLGAFLIGSICGPAAWAVLSRVF